MSQAYVTATPERRRKAGEFFVERVVDRETNAEADRLLSVAQFLRDRYDINEDQARACDAFERYYLASTRGQYRLISLEGRVGQGTPAHQQADNSSYCPQTQRMHAGQMAYSYGEVLGFPAADILKEMIEGETQLKRFGLKYCYHLSSPTARRDRVVRVLKEALDRLAQHRGSRRARASP